MRQPQPLVYVVAWALLVGALFCGANGIDGVEHSRAVASLIAIRAQQADFESELQRVRSDPTRSADALPAQLAGLEVAAAALPKCVDFVRHPALGVALVAYMDGLQDARDSVDRFAALAELRRGDAGADDEAESAADARIGLATEAMDGELASIVARDLASDCDALLARYERSFGDRLGEAEVYRLGLYLITALLLVRLMQSMRESKLRAEELRTANRTLEQRVEERTRTLSATNMALELAIDEAQSAEQDARTAREAAESANRTKSSFLANMSHEIRTPMTSILGFSERLLEEDLAESERFDAIATIRRNGEHLTQLVSDILDLSKIEAGKLSFDPVPTSLAGILTDLREATASRAEAKGLEFAVELVGLAPETVRTDPLRLEQVLFNLVGNAIKFTERGRVLLRVEYAAPSSGAGSGKLTFHVEDSGIGMDQRTIARLFRPFAQGDSSTTRRYGGTGLGLSICSHLVAGLGGEIRVTSEVGHGSVFSFDVDAGPLLGPLVEPGTAIVQESSVERTCVVDLRGMRILLAEDGEDNRRLLRHFLSSAGASVSLANDGEEAVHFALAAHAHERSFDVVLMDMQMPRVDGYAAARRLRAAGYTHPIVALTANAMASDRERCLAAGCDDYCAKPVRRAVFLEKVARWLPAGIAKETDMAIQPNRRIDAEADAGLVELVRSFVEDLGHDLESMRSALNAKDVERLALLAHRLRGAAGSYGFPEITRQAAALEGALGDGAGADTVACELASLEAICAAARGS